MVGSCKQGGLSVNKRCENGTEWLWLGEIGRKKDDADPSSHLLLNDIMMIASRDGAGVVLVVEDRALSALVSCQTEDGDDEKNTVLVGIV